MKNQVLSIWNDGGELSTEDFSHMFERFYTGQNGNSGIGLALSKEIVEMHGWNLVRKMTGMAYVYQWYATVNLGQ